MNFTEYGDGGEEDSILDLNDISSYLYSIGYFSKPKYNNIQKNKKSLKNYEIYFEENPNITFTDSSVKYGTLLSEINKIFNVDSTFEEHFRQYKEFTKSNITFANYLNHLILLIYIINKYDIMLNVSSLLDLNIQKISIIEIDSQDNSFNKKLTKLYSNLEENIKNYEKKINPNLIILIFILSYNDRIQINPQDNSINDLITKYSLYNKIYISNIDLGLLLYLEIIVFLQVYSSVNTQSEQTNNKIFNNIEKINIGKNEGQIKNKRKQAGIKSDILEKLKKPFTSRNFEKSAQYNHKSELEGNIIMTEYTMNNNNYHRSQLNILNENSSDNTILNDIKNIPNLYLFD